MTEQKGKYVTQEEIDDANEMLGAGYDQAPYEIHSGERVLMDTDDGPQEQDTGVWIKITASFRNKHLKNLKGSKLGVWLCLALHINQKNNSHPSIETICEETGYSNREVVDCVRELEKGGYLTVKRGEKRYNIYHVNFGAAYGKGNSPTSEESSQVKFTTGNGEVSSKKVLKSSLKEEPIKKNQKVAFLSEKEKEQAGAEVMAMVESVRRAKYENRDRIPEPYLELCDAYVELTGQKPTKRVLNEWLAAFSDWIGEGISPRDIRAAYENATFQVVRPGSLTNMAVALKSKPRHNEGMTKLL